MIEQILSISLQLALRLQRKAPSKCRRSPLVQRSDVDVGVGRAPPLFVRCELVAPPQPVPEPWIVAAHADRPFEQRQPFVVGASARDEYRAEMLQRFDVRGIEFDRSARQRDRAGGVAGGMARERLCQQPFRFVGSRQSRPSVNASASCSVNTRKELVRTLPWLLTASETRVIVSSSGASAMTT